MLRLRLAAVLFLALLAAGRAAAQESEGTTADPYEPVRRDALGTRLIDAPTPWTVRDHTLEVLFLHRFQQAVQNGDAHNLWGLDSGADVGLGAAWGLTPHFDVSLLRASFQEDWELAGKFMVFEQAPRIPLSLAVRAGLDYLGRPGIVEPSRPFVQLVAARRLRPGLDLLIAPSWVRGTPELRNAWNVPVGLAFALSGSSLLELEVVPRDHDLPGSVTAWHLALSHQVGGHIFQLVLGNSRAMTVDQMLGGDFAGGFRKQDVRLGFNLLRDFDY